VLLFQRHTRVTRLGCGQVIPRNTGYGWLTRRVYNSN